MTKTGNTSANTMNKKLGFIGLGNMGLPMAENLIAAGYHLQVYNRSLEKADELDQASITKCKTPAEASANVPVVITMLSDDATVKEIVTGKDGILKTLQKGGLHISMSTISPDVSRELSKLHQQDGSNYLTSPVFGRPEAAEARRHHRHLPGRRRRHGTQGFREGAGPAMEDVSGASRPGSAGMFCARSR